MKKNMKKRILSGLLCLVMSLTLLPTAAMAAARFTDVPEDFWCYEDVELAVREGLVNGTTPTTYSPGNYLTYGAAIKLAACMHKRVTTGSADFAAGDPWYKPYLDYAKANGIVTKDYPLTEAATRAGYMEIFANAIPDKGLKSGYKALTAINRVDENTIPDVPASHPQAEAIYKLYRAGILQGSDAAHNCNPNGNITRGAVAAILARIMDPSKRISFEMVGTGGMTVTEQPQDVNYVAANGKAEFTTAVTGGKSPYTYKWFESSDDGATWTAIVNDSTISGVATKKLTVKLDPSDAYTGTLYRCQISDAASHRITTRSACVTVDNTPLTVAEHPVDVTAKSGDEVWFNAFAVGGTAPVLYQWQRKASDGDWQDFPPRNSGYETSRSNSLILVVSDIDFAAGYSYRCKMTDAAGTTLYSNAATLKKTTSTLAVVEQPENVTCKVDDWVDFAVGVTGGKAPYTYRWQMKGSADPDWFDLINEVGINGTNTAELRILVSTLDFWNNLKYRCKITDANGDTVYSDAASAIEKKTFTPTRPTATFATPKITQQPKDATCAVGDTASFTVTVSGGKSPYTYQWQWSSKGDDALWVDLSDYDYVTGSKTNALGVVVLDADFHPGYQYHCVITDADGNSVTSDAVIIIEKTAVISRPNATPSRPSATASTASTGTGTTSTYGLCIVKQPVSASAAVGQKVSFTVEISGGKGPFTYQWQYSTDDGENWSNVPNSTKYSGVQTDTFKVKIESSDYASQKLIYRCKISDAAHDTVYSNSVTATYIRPTVARG